MASEGSSCAGAAGGGDSLTTCVWLSPLEERALAHAGAVASISAARAARKHILDFFMSKIDIVHHPFGNREAVNLSPESLFV
jgi:hypothetical protein